MNNLLSYCGLVDAKIRASDIDLPVFKEFVKTWHELINRVPFGSVDFITIFCLPRTIGIEKSYY